MSDLISRQAAIDAVYKCTDIFINNLPVMVDKADAYKALAELPPAQPERITLTEEERRMYKKLRTFHNGSYAKLLDKLFVSAQPEPQWIPCSERRPHYSETVIVSVLDDTGDYNLNYTDVGWITHDGTWIVDNDENNMVTAWMPLPEPYCGAKMEE